MESSDTQDAATEEPKTLLALVRGHPATEREDPEKTVLSFPRLVALEGLAAVLCLIVLIAVSLVAMAPLEEIANPGLTPNPAKAPWYFLGLQELLVYFDPWIAGVVLPGIIVGGLMLLPYVDLNPLGGIGRFWWSRRKFEITSFGLAVALWFILIAIGLFCRGPAWEWYWPWESWDLEKEPSGALTSFSTATGVAFLALYAAAGIAVAALLKRKRFPELNSVRYAAVTVLTLLALGVPLKIMLRLVLGVKYVLQTPWLNI